MFKRIVGRNYTVFWTELFQKWFQRWPARNTALPGVPKSANLTAGQTETLSKAIKQRQEQLRRWMHWHSGAGDKRSANSKTSKILDKLIQSKTRVKKTWEVYSKKYYQTRIKPHIRNGMSITEINQKIQEIFGNESPEISAEVQKICDEENKERKRHQTKKDKGAGVTHSDDLSSDVDEDEVAIDAVTLRK